MTRSVMVGILVEFVMVQVFDKPVMPLTIVACSDSRRFLLAAAVFENQVGMAYVIIGRM